MSKISKEITDKYEVLQNAFSRVVKNDPKDMIKVEIGDVKQPDKIYPQVKIKRWDEVNFSCRLIDDEVTVLTTESEKIKLIGAKKEVHLYELKDGYEFEVILNEKPTSNKLEFSIESKGVNFYYQPPLTQEFQNGYSEEFKKEIVVSETEVRDKEGKRLVYRPENVVGSYDISYKDCPVNRVGGKLYALGKLCNIFRPRIIDNAGDWVWGALHVDIDKKLLTITISQEFLDNAVYPIIVDPTFGTTTYWGSYINVNDRLKGEVHMGAYGTATSMSARMYLDSGYKGKMAMYLESDSTKVAETSEFTGSGSAGQLVTENLAGTPSITPIDYILVVATDEAVSQMSISYSATTDVDKGRSSGSITYPTFPATASFTISDRHYSVYCTYTSVPYTHTKTVTARTRIQQTKAKTITARANIKATQNKTVTAKVSVKGLGVIKTVGAKVRIQLVREKTIQAKVYIHSFGIIKTVQAKVAIFVADVTKTVQAKVRIIFVRVKTITARVSINADVWWYSQQKFRHPKARVKVDWNLGDGYQDETNYLIMVEVERKLIEPLGGVSVAQANVSLVNVNNRYTPPGQEA